MTRKIYLLLLLATVHLIALAQPGWDVIGSEGPVYAPNHFKRWVVLNFNLPKNQKVRFEMYRLNQLDHLPNLDSIFTIAKKILEPLRDSIPADGMARRADYVAGADPAMIRLRTHAIDRPAFSLENNELVQVKLDSDTLAFTLLTPTGYRIKHKQADSTYYIPLREEIVFYIIINNLADVYDLPDKILSQCLAIARQEAEIPENKKAERINYYFAYNMPTQTRMYHRFTAGAPGVKTLSIEPSMRVGFQYARGSFIPSAGLGAVFTLGGKYGDKHYIRVLWEPYFHFERNTDKSLATYRNDFITVQYTQLEKEVDWKEVHITGHFSLGYLAGKRGYLFEKHTFKMGLPTLLFGSLRFEPEFFFNRFFRNFSPSMKVVLMLE